MWFRGFIAAAGLLAAAAGYSGTALANPGFIALEGSDATALHQDPQYTPQLFSYLSGGSSLPVLVFNPAGTVTIDHPGSATLAYTATLSGITLDTSHYSALYIESPGGCCQADNTALNGYGTEVSAFIAAGGNLSIENYVGGTYDGVVPGGAAPAGTVTGVGTPYAPYCTDGETVNANGTAKGFSQPPVDGCWEHQGYETSYWTGFGYISLITADPAYTFADGSHNGSAFLALGGSLGHTGVPEPLSLSILGAGLAALGIVRRRRA